MNKEEIKDIEQSIKESIKKMCPDADTFVEFLMPFFLPLKEEYKKYLKILKKVGVKKGVQGIAEMFFGIIDASSKEVENTIKGVLAEIQKKYNDKAVPPTKQEFYKDTEGAFSFEGTMQYTKEMRLSAYALYEKRYAEIDKKVEALSEEERTLYDYFMLLILKLWVYRIITNPDGLKPSSMIFIKEFLINYYKGMNELYAKERVPKELITYIEKIKIPNEEKWKAALTEGKEEFTPETVIPVFHQADDIYNVLSKHFHKEQHQLLRNLLTEGTSTVKLLFMGQGNQLADAFKKMFTANLITSCNQQELITWIMNTFQYKSRNGKGVSLTEKYLHDIISTDQKPCKNSIIEIKKDEQGKAILFSPDRTNRYKS